MEFEPSLEELKRSVERLNEDKQYIDSPALAIAESNKTHADILAGEKKFRAIFDIIGVGIALTDEAGKIIECNKAYEKLQGGTSNGLIGRKFAGKELNVVRPDLTPMPLEEFASVRALKEKREMRCVEKGLYQPDGAIIWLSVSAEPVNMPGFGVIISYIDITARIEAEKALKENEEKYRMLAENITDVIWILNLNKNKFTYISPSVYQLRGYTAEEAMEQTMQDSLSPESLDQVLTLVYPKLQEFLANPEKKEPQHNELQQKCKDGRYVWIETITQFQLAKNGDVEVLGVTRDIEKKKQAELAIKDSEARLKLSIDTANEGTWDWNISTGEVQFNLRWAEMLGYDPDHLEKHLNMWKELVHPDDYQMVDEVLKKHLKGESDVYKAEYRLLTKTGEWKWIEDIGKVTEWDEKGNPTRAIGLHNDISQQKNIQKQLTELNATKDKFFSIIAHDLKNPFGAILGFSGLVDEECKKNHYENIQEYNNYIMQSAKSGHELLVNLLDWSRLQNGKIKFNPENYKLQRSVDNLAISFNASINEKELDLEILIAPDFMIYADRLMMETVLRNLISNAVKFTPNGGKILVQAVKVGCITEIVVSDTGVGISPERVKKLFKIEESFSTAGTKNEVGTGLGLVLCKDFLEQHKGAINVESEPGHGTKFTIILPCSAEFQPQN